MFEVCLHPFLFSTPRGGNGFDARLGVFPRRQRAPPLSTLTLDHAFHFEDLEHVLESGVTEVDIAFDRACGHPVGRLGEECDDLFGVIARRECGVDEVVLDLAVFVADERDCVREVERASGASDLLVVGDRGPGHLEVDDERKVGLVVAHAEGRRCDHALEIVALQ